METERPIKVFGFRNLERFQAYGKFSASPQTREASGISDSGDFDPEEVEDADDFEDEDEDEDDEEDETGEEA